MFSYLHKVSLEAQPATTLTLPDNDDIRILAVTVASNPNEIAAASDLYDNPVAVQILPASEKVLAPISISLDAGGEFVQIRYTLDGTEPTADSPLYRQPFTIHQTTTVKARAFVYGTPNEFVANRRYTFVEPQQATNVDVLAPGGLSYRCFEPVRDGFADVAVAHPIRSGRTATFNADCITEDNGVDVEYAGYVNIPADGVYQFSTVTDCGSRLYIDDELVVDNVCWRFRPMKRFGSVALQAGLHPIKLHAGYGRRPEIVHVYMEGPGVPWQELSRNMLFPL